MKIQASTLEILLNSQEYFICFSTEDFPFPHLPFLASLTPILSSYSLEITYLSLLHKLIKGRAELLGTSYPIISCRVWTMVNHRSKEGRGVKPPT